MAALAQLAGAAVRVALAALLALLLPAYRVYRLTASFLGALLAAAAADDVAGKVVLITGASSGIGEVII
jgi:NADPH:quinone reductase-like Zn-dependent oxidoreductase